MKSSFLSTLLQGALAFSILFSMMLCIRVVVRTRDIRTLNAQIQRINATHNTVQMIVNDCVEYSKRNPAIDPLLSTYGILPNNSGTKTGTR